MLIFPYLDNVYISVSDIAVRLRKPTNWIRARISEEKWKRFVVNTVSSYPRYYLTLKDTILFLERALRTGDYLCYELLLQIKAESVELSIDLKNYDCDLSEIERLDLIDHLANWINRSISAGCCKWQRDSARENFNIYLNSVLNCTFTSGVPFAISFDINRTYFSLLLKRAAREDRIAYKIQHVATNNYQRRRIYVFSKMP